MTYTPFPGVCLALERVVSGDLKNFGNRQVRFQQMVRPSLGASGGCMQNIKVKLKLIQVIVEGLRAHLQGIVINLFRTTCIYKLRNSGVARPTLSSSNWI